MARTVGTTARGIRAPIIKEGDDLISIVVDSVLKAAQAENFRLQDRDVIGITESLVARAQGNYATLEHIAFDINRKFEGDIALLFPILSRNRFALILQSIALSGKKIHLILNYPSDEVGNHLMDEDAMIELGINPYQDVLTETEYRKLFGAVTHPFTGIDYVQLYKELGGENTRIYLANDPKVALNYAQEILVANVHDRGRIKKLLTQAGAKKVYGLADILNEPINGSGYNPDYGLLGSNRATDTKVKLFPRDCQSLVEDIQKAFKDKTGKLLEVMIYGDGAFKDPRGKIWELADPVVSPGFTEGLRGMPSELKLKYLADGELSDLSSAEMDLAVKQKIKTKDDNLRDKPESLGTTPRQLTDLLGSLCDLVSGSGDKGTPMVLVQGYFDNYASE